MIFYWLYRFMWKWYFLSSGPINNIGTTCNTCLEYDHFDDLLIHANIDNFHERIDDDKNFAEEIPTKNTAEYVYEIEETIPKY